MALNGSSGGSTPTVKPAKKAGKTPPALKGALAGFLVIAGAVAAFFYLMPSEEPGVQKEEPKKTAKIKEVKPATVAKQAVESPREKSKKFVPYWDQPTTNGLSPVQARIWRYHRNPPSWTNTTSLTTPKSAYEIFPTSAENAIACLLSLKPGESLVGTPVYGKKFTEEFIKSCEVPIIVSKDDTPYQQQLKKDMIATKIELRQRMADGEDLGKILLQAREENQRLAQIKREVESEMREMIKSGATSEADIDDCVAAANKLLDAKGIAPISLNPVSKQMFMRMIISKSSK